MSLSEYALTQNQRAEFARGEKLRDYVALIGDLPVQLKGLLVDLGKLISSTMKLVQQKTREYPLNPNYPPELARQVNQMHDCFLRPARERCDTLSARIQSHLAKLEGPKIEDFIRFQPAYLAKLDGERANGLLSEVEWLRRLPEAITAIESEILHLQKVFAGRDYLPISAATFHPPIIEVKEDSFDPRLS